VRTRGAHSCEELQVMTEAIRHVARPRDPDAWDALTS
jgi:hypothetical protein